MKLNRFKTAFTLGELTAALIVITMVVLVTLPITAKKLEKVDKYAYYMAYTAMLDINANIISQNEYDIDNIAYSENADNLIAENPSASFKYYNAIKGDSSLADEITCILENGSTGYGDQCKLSPPLLSCVEGYKLCNGSCIPQYQVCSSSEILCKSPNKLCNGVCMTPEAYLTNCKTATAAANTAATFCNKIADVYNVNADNCSVATSKVTSAVSSGNFKDVTPHIILSNGLRIYLGSDITSISELTGASKNDRVGFKVYVDINGTSGKGKLYQDVFPFYLLVSGKTVPGYRDDKDNPAGANNKNHLSLNVVYDNYSSNTREIKLLLRDTNFRSAACAIGYVTSSKYCDTAKTYNVCKKEYHDCRFIVNKPFKLF